MGWQYADTAATLGGAPVGWVGDELYVIPPLFHLEQLDDQPFFYSLTLHVLALGHQWHILSTYRF